MNRLVTLLLSIALLVALTSCGSNEALDELKKLGDLYEQVEEYYEDENEVDTDADEQDEVSYDGAWWTEPFHLKYEYKALEDPDKEYSELEVVYDGEEIYLADDNYIYYVTPKGDVTRTYMIFKKQELVTFTDSKYEEETVEYELENNMVHISSIIAYSKSIRYDDPNLWENLGSETKEDYECDIFTEKEHFLEKNKFWVDSKTGIIVWHEDEPIELLDGEELSEIYGVQYKLISFESKNPPKVSDVFDLNDYGGDPEEAEEKALSEAKAYIPTPPGNITKEDYSLYSGMYTIEIEWALDDTKSYVEELRNAGFNLDEMEYDFGNIYSFNANDEAGYKISISWSEDDNGSIMLTKPTES